MVEITDQVALPEPVANWGKAMKKMDVGHSFPVTNGDEKDVRYVAWNLFHRKNEDTGEPVSEKRFTVKRDPLDGENFRCWRER